MASSIFISPGANNPGVIDGNLTVTGDADIDQDLNVGGAADIVGALTAAELFGLDKTQFEQSTITLTGNQIAIDVEGIKYLRCNNATLLTIQGLNNGVEGQILFIQSVGAGQVDLANLSGSASAEDQLANLVTSAASSLAAGKGSALYVYSNAKWRLLNHEQGEWITPAFVAGDFTGSASMTWTVAAGDVADFKYYLKGRILFVKINISTTSIGGTPSTQLLVLTPGGYSVAVRAISFARVADNGGAGASSYVDANVAANRIRFYRSAADINWTASTDNALVEATIQVLVT